MLNIPCKSSSKWTLVKDDENIQMISETIQQNAVNF